MTPTPPTADLRAKPGRLYVVAVETGLALSYVGPYTNPPFFDWRRDPETARKYSTVGDATCFAETCLLAKWRNAGRVEIHPFDSPHSVDADLARMHQRTLDRERVARGVEGTHEK